MLTTKGRYAVMAIVEMANYSGGDALKISDIACSQNIASNYLEQIFRKLKAAEIVVSTRGPGGGYHLKKKPSELFISEVINAVEENVEIVRCKHESKGCMPNSSKCSTHYLWSGLEKVIMDYFASYTIYDVISGKLRNEFSNKKI